MTPLAPLHGAVESAHVVTIPLEGEVRGLAHATRLAVQALEPVTVYGSIAPDRWDVVAQLLRDDIAPVPFVEALKCDPDGAAVCLASFPLR